MFLVIHLDVMDTEMETSLISYIVASNRVRSNTAYELTISKLFNKVCGFDGLVECFKLNVCRFVRLHLDIIAGA